MSLNHCVQRSRAYLISLPKSLMRAPMKRVAQKCGATLSERAAVARYGEGIRHPLCRTALGVWSADADWYLALELSITTARQLNDCDKHIRETKSLISRLQREQKMRDAKTARLLLQRWKSLRSEAAAIQQTESCIPTLRALRKMAADDFSKASVAAVRARDFSAFKALERVGKRWREPDNQIDHRTSAVLHVLRSEAVRRAWAIGGAAAGWNEAATAGSKLLSDEIYGSVFTARQLHRRLIAMRVFSPSEEQLHQVRRLAKKLGIRLLPDRRGPKARPRKTR